MLTKIERQLVDTLREELAGYDPIAANHDAVQQLRGFEYLHNHIDDLFNHKTSSLVHHTGICAAFASVHTRRDIDDPSFAESLLRDMDAQAIPRAEQHEAIKVLAEIRKELAKDFDTTDMHWRERDIGFHPDLEAVMAPGKDLPDLKFTEIKR